MNIKKLLVFLFFVILVLLLEIGCNNTYECVHNIENVKAQESTCLKEGNIEYYHCTKCNKYYINEELTTEKSFEELIIPKKGHTESDWIIDTESTCSNQGFKYKECIVCKEKINEEVIEKLNIVIRKLLYLQTVQN